MDILDHVQYLVQYDNERAIEWFYDLTSMNRRRVRVWLEKNPPPCNWKGSQIAYAYTEMPVCLLKRHG